MSTGVKQRLPKESPESTIPGVAERNEGLALSLEAPPEGKAEDIAGRPEEEPDDNEAEEDTVVENGAADPDTGLGYGLQIMTLNCFGSREHGTSEGGNDLLPKRMLGQLKREKQKTTYSSFTGGGDENE